MPKKPIALPSQEFLQTYFDYQDGVVTRKKLPDNFIGKNTSMYNTRFAGKSAISGYNNRGYATTLICSTKYLLHRVIWKLCTGNEPLDQIDHINFDKTDNRIENLREANNSENNRNVGLSKNNTSGFKGVSKTRDKSKWRARSRLNGAEYLIGIYATKEEAAKAYYLFAKEHHGDFMRCAEFENDGVIPHNLRDDVVHSDMISGIKGISWNKSHNGWVVRVTKNGVRYDSNISFKRLEDAEDALLAMKSYFLDFENYKESDYNFRPALIGKSAKNNNPTSERYITFHKLTNKYRLRMPINGITKQIGVYDTLDEAIVAKQAALELHGDYSNFG